ncbi:MAG TPA: putative glycolipid-binding domain-containing protein [Thermoanaerobaculia bacterium]|nr:putative glycolipid-binding domain-containing protein [Thermoanaerobaculia bacterium]
MIVWRRLDVPGHEACRLSGQTLEGTAVLARPASALSYVVVCDSAWRTLSVSVQGWIESRRIDISLSSSDLLGCTDIDLNFSPSTNTLPIRRLDLRIGESASVTVAWLRFPEMTLEPLQQTYTRAGERTWTYTSDDFRADVEVDGEGLVVTYEGLWVRA